jgi:hypothetical protein
MFKRREMICGILQKIQLAFGNSVFLPLRFFRISKVRWLIGTSCRPSAFTVRYENRSVVAIQVFDPHLEEFPSVSHSGIAHQSNDVAKAFFTYRCVCGAYDIQVQSRSPAFKHRSAEARGSHLSPTMPRTDSASSAGSYAMPSLNTVSIFSISAMLVEGSPAMTTKSACLPGAMVPI